MEQEYQRVYAEISLDAVEHNISQIRQAVQKEAKIIAVIKADAYGHGAVPIGRLLETKEYVWGYAVATVEEGVQLRNAGLKKPVLLLGACFENQYETILNYEIRPAVFELSTAIRLNELAEKQNKRCAVHIKLDTGMNRIGIRADENAAQQILQIAALEHIHIEGIFTHFARADEKNKDAANRQFVRFCSVVDTLKSQGLQIELVHCANSAAIVDLPQFHLDAVRAGIILYGLQPSEEVEMAKMKLQPVLALKSTVTYVKTLQPQDEVSYGGTFQAKDKMRLATIPVGYGDGYPRSLSNRGYVLIHGKKAPICGRVCMDQFMVDVSGIPEAKKGDTVTLLGEDGGSVITMEELGGLSGRFNYEFACDLGKRIPRIFYQNKKIVAIQHYFS
jgi:alanine racemase